MKRISCCWAILLFGVVIPTAAHATVTIETVPVGDIGNPNDPATGFGGVNYAYSIGKYEVTYAQYAEFLNAVAATDPKLLWSAGLGMHGATPGISRSGSAGSYTYSVTGAPNQPVGPLSFENVARFANWMNNGQPHTGVEDATTTEDGAYTIPASAPFQLLGIDRNAGAKWFIPSDNEWYKAAYYQPASKGGDADGYWAYPMRTNSFPFSAPPPGIAAPEASKAGNFNYTDQIANGYNDGLAVTGSTTFASNVDYLTDVGAYTSASSYYGTFDQGGNAFEFTEGTDVTAFGAFRTERGGDAYLAGGVFLQSLYRLDFRSQSGYTGFRLATIAVPEPSTAVLAIGSIVVPVMLRRRAVSACL